ncbi:cystathionine beta-lyase [Roseibium alexandrii]|uniref:Cystathionine beta-lyase, bacterial n=1 Tax=Roseibium alexandrii (strain DSM 17067 / NCIMB 14079 / DFL-11) TaxID=244592 RepID=A0A5E8GTX6_ROSAD|nr:cystathionine beta-lyase [Roseibium alexandrii]EEE42946.2 cystathionine beta-lyase, bacterial [Roseibium alexandrii DFL-11]
MTNTPDNKRSIETVLAHSGRDPSGFHGFVNPPVVHASTVLYPDTKTMVTGAQKFSYARRGNPTTDSLEDALKEIEGAAGVKLANSGLNAIALAILSCVKSGDHILIADTAYGPTRHFADTVLPGLNVDVEYYNPAVGANIKSLFKPNTTAVFTEAPGSLTFEMQDIPAIAAAAHEIDATVLMDNTWASPLYCQPIAFGVDLSIQAGTKYIVGHSDVMLGTIAASEKAWHKLDTLHGAMGSHVGPDDVYLGLRGLRTLSVRLERHQKNTAVVLDWLKTQPAIGAIRYPALESDPGHEIWKRDFSGASGLCGFDFATRTTQEQAYAFLDALTLFGLGYSWGGFESLAIPVRLKGMRSATNVDPDLHSVRLHIGLEDPEDLIKDLGQALDKAFA